MLRHEHARQRRRLRLFCATLPLTIYAPRHDAPPPFSVLHALIYAVYAAMIRQYAAAVARMRRQML